MKKLVLLFVLCGLPTICTATSAIGSPSGSMVTSYDLDVSFYPDAVMDYAGFIGVLYGERPGWNKEDSFSHYPHMLGKAEVTVQPGANPSDTIVFYLHSELRAHTVMLGQTELPFTQETVYYPSSYSVVATKVTTPVRGVSGEETFSIEYGGVFNPSCSGSPSSYMRIDTNGAYLRGYGYSLWYPVFIGAGETSYQVPVVKATITTPEDFTAVFTGQKIGEDVEGERRVSVWRGVDVELTDMQMTVRPFEVAEEQDIYLYFLPDDRSREASGDILAFVRTVKALFEKNYREIRHTQQLHIAELPNFASGISSGNMIGITSGQWRHFEDETKSESMKLLVSHELVHPYVQVKVDNDNPVSALVTEGFPSYFHLPILAEMLGEEWYQQYMSRVEEAYIARRESKTTRRGHPLPQEKPIVAITYDEIGLYKDTFILNDRVRLFLHSIREKLGKEEFRQFTRELCHRSTLTVPALKALILKYLPESGEDTALWLETSQYPERFHLKSNR